MEVIITETIFWILFVILNGSQYIINYIFYFEKSKFLPYINDYKTGKKIGIAGSVNQDFFRYNIELSVIILLSRIINLSDFVLITSFFFLITLVFNLYQYSFRRIYECEPNFYSDAKLLKNGFVIVWHESKLKSIGILLIFISFFLGIVHFFKVFLSYSYKLETSSEFYFITFIWLLTLLWALLRVGLHTKYPNDIYRRYHFSILEIFMNFKRSFLNRKISKKKQGKEYFQARQEIKMELIDGPPNLHFIFLESYGSYFYKEKSIQNNSFTLFDSFKNNISLQGWASVSNYSKSPTTGGQSWLTYSTVLYGLLIDNNTYFENYLRDPDFQKANHLLRLLKNQGYKNHNLNPISPIKGINVPYDEMREFYAIDNWILKPDLKYSGDVYGFGECPPDQFSMNFMKKLITEEKIEPYTFFYLTKNTHSPFIPPEMAHKWQDLNHDKGSVHIHKGFLKNPSINDYSKAIEYQFKNLQAFITEQGKDNDIFILMGDHQPPILSNPDIYGYETPVHVISKDKNYVNSYKEYGFDSDLRNCKSPINHEAMYSIFLRTFISRYGKNEVKLPDYEPFGLQL